jgi:glucosylceramidase
MSSIEQPKLEGADGSTSPRWSLGLPASLCALLLVVCATLIAAPAVYAQEKAKVQPLTAVERSAVSVTSLAAAADPSLGVIVTATFKGDVARYLGQDDLRRDQLELALHGTGSYATPSELVDAGGGFVAVRFPTLTRVGRKSVVSQAMIHLYSAEPDRSLSSGAKMFALRVGNRVIFDVSGIAPAQMAKLTLDVSGTAVRSLRIDPSHLSVKSLRSLRASLTRALSNGLEPELRQEEQARARLESSIRSFGELARRVHVSRPSLLDTYRRSASAVTFLKARIAALTKLIAQANNLLDASLTPAVKVVQTDSALSENMAAEPSLPLSTLKPAGMPVVDVDQGVRYQQFSGLGAALTDSSAWLIQNNLSPAARLSLIRELFGDPDSPYALPAPAIHLGFLRVGLGASGAMTVGAPYSYDDLLPGESDPSLSEFSIAHDLPYIIPVAQQALAINPQLTVLGSPWSPPAWMKTNDALNNLGGQGSLLPSDYGPYANYIVDAIQAYAKAGVPISAVTPANEPSSGQTGVSYPGLTLPAPDEAELIASYLAPALRAAGLGTQIYGTDNNWDSMSYSAALAASVPADDLAGIAWHCYFGSPTVMSQMQEADPELKQIVDECAPEIRPVGTPEYLISSLRNWASVVSIWAVALDPSGGPIQAGNNCPGCTGAVTINEQTGTATPNLKYFQLGQVSAFVQSGAWRIGSPSQVSYGIGPSGYETATSGLDDVAFQNPDGSKVLVAYNNSRAPITFAVESDGRYFDTTLPSRAMTTFVWS